MAQTCGTKASTSSGESDRALHSLGRLVGFSLLSALGLGILATVVLIPPYASLLQARYERDCNRALNQDYRDRIEANELFMQDIRQLDVVAIRTLESSVLGQDSLNPGRQLDPRRKEWIPPAANLAPNPRPEPVPAWITRLSLRVTRPNVRRGLVVLSAAALLAAVVLFWGPAGQRNPEASAT